LVAADELVWTHRPALRRPVLILAFEGWNDAGEAASTAAAHLIEAWDATAFASVDPENFYDFTATRPQVELLDGVTRIIEWPTNEFVAAAIPGAGRDAIILTGAEPQMRWKTFCRLVMDVVDALGVEFVISLGALLADVPHSRPTRVTGTASSEVVISRYSLRRSNYEGPTGIIGVFHDQLAGRGIESCSLWATVPHYLPSTTSPKAALALVERAAEILGVSVPTIDLQIGAVDYERQVNDVVDADDEMRGFVRTLEESYDEDDETDYEEYDVIDEGEFEDAADAEARPADGRDPRTAFMTADGNLPTGDELASELERFLRDQPGT
jgi:proteasome assembly chaperone (PAC2) family protein